MPRAGRVRIGFCLRQALTAVGGLVQSSYMSYALGIDASTQSCSAIVIDTDRGDIVANASVSFGKDLPQYGAPSGFIAGGRAGEVHSDPRMWLDALEMVLERLKGQCDLSRIESISGAGQQHGSVYLNDKWLATVSSLDAERSLSAQLGPCLSRSTSPIWMDTSTGDECREIAAAVGGDDVVCAKSGSIAIERFTGPQIRRFFKNDPEGYSATVRIHLVSSFLCSVLCGGDAGIDTGDGAGMNLVNIGTWSWDGDLLDATAPGLAGKLPPVVAGGARAGHIAPFFVKKFGFAAETPVVVFTGDNPSSLVGMGATKPGKLVISLGTSDTFFAAMPDVVADPAGSGHVFGNPAGGSMSLQCFVNGSLAREAVKDRFEYDWADFTSALVHTPAGNEGNLMVPFFRPEISPRIDLPEPIFSGSAGFISGECPDAMIRACVEGQFLNMKLRTAWMGLSTETIYLTGGASANDGIAQVVADIFQAEVQRLAVSGSVALGGAIRAASHATGVSIESLQAVFCQPVAGSEIRPRVGADCYAEALVEFQGLLG
jgi:xylulokinase